MNLLESAGFSRSNPYYIVKQGKVRFVFIEKIMRNPRTKFGGSVVKNSIINTP